MQILQKRRKNLMCVLSPHVGLAIEKEKYNVNFEPPCMYCKKGKKIQCVF
jgi:hypothetical protein